MKAYRSFNVASFVRPKRQLRRVPLALFTLIAVFAALLFAVVTIIQARAPGVSPWPTPQAISGVSRALTPILRFYPQMDGISSMAPALDQTGASLVAYSPAGEALAVGTPFGVVICSVDARTVRLRDFVDTGGPVTALAYAPNGNTIASGSYTDTIQVWDLHATGRLSQALGDRQDAVNSLAYSPDGVMLASGSADGGVRLRRTADGELVRALKGHRGAVRSVAFSPDESLVASGGVDGSIHMWQVDGDFSTSSIFDDSGGVPVVSFSHSGSLLAFGSGDGLVRLLDANTGKLVQTWSGQGSTVTALEFSPDDSILASGSHDGSVFVRSVADGKVLAMLNNSKGVASLTFSPDGAILAVGSIDGEVEMWVVAAITAGPNVEPTQPAVMRVPVVAPTQPAVASWSGAPACTDIATFVGDVTIPDNTLVAPEALLNKTWRFRNVGTCTWGAGYRLGFFGGNAMGAEPQEAVASTPPGGTMDVTVPLVAPTMPSGYQDSWQLVNAAGAAFGPHATVVIQVAGGSSSAAGACSRHFGPFDGRQRRRFGDYSSQRAECTGSLGQRSGGRRQLLPADGPVVQHDVRPDRAASRRRSNVRECDRGRARRVRRTAVSGRAAAANCGPSALPSCGRAVTGAARSIPGTWLVRSVAATSGITWARATPRT